MHEMRQVIELITLTICAYTDIKEQEIYTIPVALAGAAGLLISIIELIISPQIARKALWLRYIIIPLVLGIILSLLIYVFSNYIGLGDGIIILATGLITGIKSEILVITLSVLIAGLFAGILIIAKRTAVNSKIPFAPFFLVAFFIMIVT